ncbi:ATPase, T2SS/T4P/T4SS family [Proteiniclasticum sp.]|uniref:ATPase, T2SS/T4P/T4SS family n=1 Tax=Proteiniclasticum sp. TaxID=2053595 RepID=UPI00289EA946|nr:ATPase, T2SS/T4P/T4SS family [Proteiniclasticum sp.]
MELDQIISQGIEAGASDIHFIPSGTTVNLYFRNGDDLVPLYEMDHLKYQVLVQKAKAMAQMNISEKRMPQDGILKTGNLSVRVSTLRCIHGESLVLRLFRKELITLENLGISPMTQSQIMKRLIEKTGIFLICGETGMGKSTTMYAMMMKLRDERLKVISIEDPVEREIEGIVQTQINETSGFGYERAIFAALRQDPDYICIGEIRSRETAGALIRASLTGHRVISTIHAHDFDSAKRRIMDFGISEEYISVSLTTVMNQKLYFERGRRRVNGCMEFYEDRVFSKDK